MSKEGESRYCERLSTNQSDKKWQPRSLWAKITAVCSLCLSLSQTHAHTLHKKMLAICVKESTVSGRYACTSKTLVPLHFRTVLSIREVWKNWLLIGTVNSSPNTRLFHFSRYSIIQTINWFKVAQLWVKHQTL